MVEENLNSQSPKVLLIMIKSGNKIIKPITVLTIEFPFSRRKKNTDSEMKTVIMNPVTTTLVNGMTISVLLKIAIERNVNTIMSNVKATAYINRYFFILSSSQNHLDGADISAGNDDFFAVLEDCLHPAINGRTETCDLSGIKYRRFVYPDKTGVFQKNLEFI